MLLVISSFLLQYSYGVRDGTDKENLASGETQSNTSICLWQRCIDYIKASYS